MHCTNPWVTAGVTALATAGLCLPVRKALLHHGTMDIPNVRSSHTTPVPRGGGIAALLGAATATLTCGARLRGRTTAALVGLAAVGLADDITGHVPARVRLAGQLVTGATGFALDPTDAIVAATTTSGVVNVVNFMDGINGISALTAIVWGINAILLDDESNAQLAVIGALTAGAGVGFLPHNAPTARLFLGDVGSYALGAAMAAGVLSQHSLRNRYRVAAPLLAYAADASQALLKRASAGKALGEPHREHIYQVLVDRFHYSHSQVAIFYAILATALAAASHLPARHMIAISALITAPYLTISLNEMRIQHDKFRIVGLITSGSDDTAGQQA